MGSWPRKRGWTANRHGLGTLAFKAAPLAQSARDLAESLANPSNPVGFIENPDESPVKEIGHRSVH
jgi:hypothetical protein